MTLKIKKNRKEAGLGFDHFTADHDAAWNRGEGDTRKRGGHAGGKPDGKCCEEAGIKRDYRGQHGCDARNAADEEKDIGHLHSPRLDVLR